MKLNLIAN
jgi:hypothetical protein